MIGIRRAPKLNPSDPALSFVTSPLAIYTQSKNTIMFYHAPLLIVLSLIWSASAKCYEPSPAFQLPSWKRLAPKLQPTFEKLDSKLQDIASQAKYDKSSYSVEVTSSDETLWGSWHTARERDVERPGVAEVDSASQFRIASITKVFTTLAILYQHNAGNLSLDSPVLDYIPELDSPKYVLPWKDITIRILASQLSGIPREFAQSDLLNLLSDPSSLGLPPTNHSNVPNCDEYTDYHVPCNASQLLEQLKLGEPLFAPNQRSTYSNVNFVLLGQVIERVTGMSYTDFVSAAILEPLNMTSSSFEKPSDEHAVLPLLPPDAGYTRDGKNYWDVDEGVQNPTGGLYSSSKDLSKFLRYILTHFNSISTGVNWLMPASWSTGMNSFYGMPFEIFRTDKILEESRRPVTFVTKSGGLPGYYSRILILEEYGLGITILIGGSASLLGDILEVMSVDIVRAAEAAIWDAVEEKYTGYYVASDPALNSSLQLASSPSKGLHLTSFVSNSTDVLAALFSGLLDDSQPWRAQLMPTLLYQDEENQKGEIWREIVVNDRPQAEARIWDDECVTDIDQLSYGGKPINKIVFFEDESIELPAWNVTMRKAGSTSSAGGLFVQG